jgi:hypothetical protein
MINMDMPGETDRSERDGFDEFIPLVQVFSTVCPDSTGQEESRAVLDEQRPSAVPAGYSFVHDDGAPRESGISYPASGTFDKSHGSLVDPLRTALLIFHWRTTRQSFRIKAFGENRDVQGIRHGSG